MVGDLVTHVLDELPGPSMLGDRGRLLAPASLASLRSARPSSYAEDLQG